VTALPAENRDFVRPVVQAVLQELLEAEMTALGAEKGERTAARLGYRSAYYGRLLVTRVGKLELRVPQDRQGRSSTELFERYQRSGKALVPARAEMYFPGGIDPKDQGDHRAPGFQRRPRWSARSGALCGHSFSAAAISATNTRLDQELARFARPVALASLPPAPQPVLPLMDTAEVLPRSLGNIHRRHVFRNSLQLGRRDRGGDYSPPPHRSQRAELPHRAPTSGHDVEPLIEIGCRSFGLGGQ
jgi:hypothetical protein